MAETYFMGIDGGGSTVRVVITTRALDTIASGRINSAVNPSYAGQEQAQATIREAMRTALSESRLAPQAIAAVGIGVAGTVDTVWQPWLRETVQGVLPNVLVRTSGDMETALAGSRGEPVGLIVIAGTGSVIYGQNRDGAHKMVGGWGMALGDEGSGNWLGREAVRAVMADDDGIGPETALRSALLGHLQLKTARDLIVWVYRDGPVNAARIASLAPVVMACADDGDAAAQAIINRGAEVLAQSATAILERLDLQPETIAYAGSLLENPTALRDALNAQLDIDPPPARYAPVVGAALLAARAYEMQRS